jgi:hypothetical protein
MIPILMWTLFKNLTAGATSHNRLNAVLSYSIVAAPLMALYDVDAAMAGFTQFSGIPLHA